MSGPAGPPRRGHGNEPAVPRASAVRVAFNASLLADPSLRGWNRYTLNLLAGLAGLGVELLLYGRKPVHESHLGRLPASSYRVVVAPPLRYPVWEQWWLPRQCARDRPDLLHSPFNYGLPWFCPCPRVLTLHDAIDHVYYFPRTPLRQRLRPAFFQSRLYHWAARTRA